MVARKELTERELSLLLSFLSDRDPDAVRLAREQLLAAARDRSKLKSLIETLPDSQTREAAQAFFEETRIDELQRRFLELGRQGPDLDLEEGAVLLASFAYPREAETISTQLDHMAAEIDGRTDVENASLAQQMELLRTYLFEEKGFLGDIRDYSNPDNSYMNAVLERKLGIPISLSCLYLFIAWRLNIPARGIGLPGHFIVGHDTYGGLLLVDPFHSGRLLTRRDCETLVRQHGLTFRDEYLNPNSNDQILFRMIVNLINVYTDHKEFEKARWLGRALEGIRSGG